MFFNSIEKSSIEKANFAQETTKKCLSINMWMYKNVCKKFAKKVWEIAKWNSIFIHACVSSIFQNETKTKQFVRSFEHILIFLIEINLLS